MISATPTSQKPATPDNSADNLRTISGSRQRFEQYRRKVKEKLLPKGSIHSTGDARQAKDRVRTSWQLVMEFFRLLHPYRWPVILTLLSVTLSTTLGLLPPAGTKFVVDYVLNGQ